MDVGAVYNNSLDLQSLLINGNGNNRVNNGYDGKDNSSDYAKKGEPIYMAEMDSDSDGVVSFDEFKDYCKTNNVSSKGMVKMSMLAATYHTLKAEEDAIDYISKLTPNVFPKLKQADSGSVYAKEGDNKYNISMDSNRDKMVTYQEYMTYCEQNVKSNELKAYTKAEETAGGNLEISNYGKALESYESSEGNALKTTFEELV